MKALRRIGSFSRAAAAAAALAATIASAGAAPQVSGAASPWYAESLGSLGFGIAQEPVEIPDFTVPALAGGSASLSALKGKVVLLNFWATWCPPCRAEMPSIQKLSDALKGADFAVMAVSVGEKPATVKAFIAKEKYRFPVYLDEKGSVGGLYGASSIPTTYVVGKDGRAIARIVGSTDYASPEAIAAFRELAGR